MFEWLTNLFGGKKEEQTPEALTSQMPQMSHDEHSHMAQSSEPTTPVEVSETGQEAVPTAEVKSSLADDLESSSHEETN